MDERGVIQEQPSSEVSNQSKNHKVGQEQIHSLLFSEKLSWQAIIYDLINTEQLDPWDIDISLLSTKYLEKIRKMEELNFFISSKVLLAASLLLRIKSEIVIDNDLKLLNDILYGRKDEKRYVQERIYLDEDIPDLIPRTPLPRFRKVSLQELMSALGKAITTETRRFKRVILDKQYEIEAAIALPRRRMNLLEETEKTYVKLKKIFSEKKDRLAFSEFSGKSKEERIMSFIPLLHLDHQNKVWLEQEITFGEIWILLREMYENQNAEMLEQMRKEAEVEIEKLVEEEKQASEANKDEVLLDEAKELRHSFDNPVADAISEELD